MLLHLLDPPGQGRCGLVHVAAVDGKATGDGGPRCGFADVPLRLREAAALVGAEGADELAGEVVVLQEGIDAMGMVPQ